MLRSHSAAVVTFVAAASDSGKTTLIERIVPILKKKGLRVAVVKHAHEGFRFDQPGKDSWRFSEAGADAVMLVGPDSLALVKKTGGHPQSDIDRLLQEADIVIQEGFKSVAARNRIEVFRQGVSGTEPLCMSDSSILAVVSDTPLDLAVPRLDLNSPHETVDFIMRCILKPAP